MQCVDGLLQCFDGLFQCFDGPLQSSKQKAKIHWNESMTYEIPWSKIFHDPKIQDLKDEIQKLWHGFPITLLHMFKILSKFNTDDSWNDHIY